MATYTDNFNRANGAIDVGNPKWVVRPGGYAMPQISANVAQCASAVGAYYNETFTNDQYCWLNLNGMNATFSSRNAWLFVRGNASDQACYAVQIYSSDNADTGYDVTATILRVAANGATTSLNSAGTIDIGGNHKWELRAVGTTISVYIDDSLYVQASDGTIAGGMPGFYGSAAQAGVTVDNWQAGDLGTPPSNNGIFTISIDSINTNNVFSPDRSKTFNATNWATGSPTVFTEGYDIAPDGTRTASRVQISVVPATQIGLFASNTKPYEQDIDETLLYFKLNPSTLYTYSTWVKFLTTHPGGLEMQCQQYTPVGGAGYIGSTNSSGLYDAVGLNTWTRVSWTFTTFPGTDYGYLPLYTGWSPETGTDAVFWGAKLEAGSAASGVPNYVSNPYVTVVAWGTQDGTPRTYNKNMFSSSQARSIGPDLGGNTWFIQSGMTGTYNVLTAPNGLVEASRYTWLGNGAAGALEIAPRYNGDIYIPVSAGTKYCWSMWMKNNGTTGSWSSNMDLGFYDSGKNPLESNWVHSKNVSGSLDASNWSRVFVTGTAPAGAAYAMCTNLNGYNPSWPLDMYVWGAKLEVGDVPTGDASTI